MRSSFQVKIRILSREVGYELREKSVNLTILGKFVSKP